MARNEAFRILISSISKLSTTPTANASASFSMIFRSSSLSFSFSFFESFSNSFLNFFGKITAAAKTGPAKQPLPASSQPASNKFLCKQSFSKIYFSVSNVALRASKLGISDAFSKTSAYCTIPFLSIKKAERLLTPFIPKINSAYKLP
jgi:hypothetical protein